jgi:hypothetical protein
MKSWRKSKNKKVSFISRRYIGLWIGRKREWQDPKEPGLSSRGGGVWWCHDGQFSEQYSIHKTYSRQMFYKSLSWIERHVQVVNILKKNDLVLMNETHVQIQIFLATMCSTTGLWAFIDLKNCLRRKIEKRLLAPSCTFVNLRGKLRFIPLNFPLSFRSSIISFHPTVFRLPYGFRVFATARSCSHSTSGNKRGRTNGK